jgi:hypothetical protein
MTRLKSDDPNYVGDDEWLPMKEKKKKKKKTLSKKKDIMLRCEGCCRKFTKKSNRGRHFLRLTRQFVAKGLLSKHDIGGLDEQTLRDAMAEEGSMECLHYAKTIENTHGIEKKKLVGDTEGWYFCLANVLEKNKKNKKKRVVSAAPRPPFLGLKLITGMKWNYARTGADTVVIDLTGADTVVIDLTNDLTDPVYSFVVPGYGGFRVGFI